MPGQVFPPEGFGPWAIAGERLTAATRVRAVAPHDKAFISDLRWMNVSVASSWSARLRRSGDQRWAPLARPARQTGRSAYRSIPPRFSAWSSASLGRAAAWPPAMQCRHCRRPPEMPVGYHRNVPAASPTGSGRRTSDPRAAPRPGGWLLAETSLSRSRRVRRSCLGSPRRAISPYVAASRCAVEAYRLTI